MTVREQTEQNERLILCSAATLAADSLGRGRKEELCQLRTCFQRDRDRILHCKAFRRLKHKTQVFLSPEGDHYRTRLTHTLEVSQIARTVSRALRLNEDLTEAIALGHDLGHTPFGHAGERALSQISGLNFYHYEQSVRVVEKLEKDGKGLNLTKEVLNGIERHTGGEQAFTAEGRVVRLADKIAYINHDIDDAIRAGILKNEDIPRDIREKLGESHSSRINNMINAVISASVGADIKMPQDIAEKFEALHQFMFEAVYFNPIAKSEESKAIDLIGGIYRYLRNHPEKLQPYLQSIAEEEGIDRAVCDAIAGMTDSFATRFFIDIYVPKNWQM